MSEMGNALNVTIVQEYASGTRFQLQKCNCIRRFGISIAAGNLYVHIYMTKFKFSQSNYHLITTALLRNRIKACSCRRISRISRQKSISGLCGNSTGVIALSDTSNRFKFYTVLFVNLTITMTKIAI